MTAGFEFDEEASKKLEATYLTPDVSMQRYEVLKALGLKQGEHALDIGCGPGLLAYDMAKTVGSDGRVCGVDLSEPMLAMSRRRCLDRSWVEIKKADATKLPFADDRFDAACAIQVYKFVQDIPIALAELYRVLRPGGRAVILDTDYDSLVIHIVNRKLTQRILAAWDEHFVHPDLPRVLSSQLRGASFAIWRREVMPIFNPEYHMNTYSYGLIGFMASFAVGRNGVTQDEADAWVAELHELGKQGKYFFSLNRYMFVVVKPGAP